MKKWLMVAGATLAAVMGIFFYGRTSGRNEQKSEQNERVIENDKTSQKASDHIRSLSDAQRREWLRNHANNE